DLFAQMSITFSLALAGTIESTGESNDAAVITAISRVHEVTP
ncbi:MAG: hypothetical protein RL228_847, partial [Actinomycetota bacterium]